MLLIIEEDIDTVRVASSTNMQDVVVFSLGEALGRPCYHRHAMS